MSVLIEKFRNHPVLGTAIFFIAIASLFFMPILLQGKLLAPGDALVQYLPAFQVKSHLWTTQILCGFPWYADPQSQVFYPPKQIVSLIPFGWNLYIIGAYVLAGFFTAMYAFSLTGSWTAALVAGCIFGFNGFLLSNLRHTTMLHVAAWLPLVLLSVRRLRIDNDGDRTKQAQWFALAVLATALLCLAGHPQMFCYGLALVGMSVIAETLEAKNGKQISFAVLSLSAISLGVGISAVTLLPCAELASFSWRWNMTYKLFVEYALLPVNLITLVFPFTFGSFKNSIYGCNYFGAYDMQTVAGYCGLFTFLLFPLGIFYFRKNKITIFWAFALLLFFILIFGDVGPISQIAYQLPCYNRFRAPTRHFLEISMALSCLAAYGVAALAANKVSAKAAMRAHGLFVGLFLVAAIFACLCAGASQERVAQTASGVFGKLPWDNPALGVPIILFIIGSIIYFLCLNRPQIRWHLLIAIFVVDFATFALGSEYFAVSPSSSRLHQPTHTTWLNSEAVKTHQRVLSLRGNSGNQNELPVNLCMLWKVENACGYENLLPERISRLLSMKEGGFLTGSWESDSDHTLDVLAVKYVLLPKNDNRYPAPTSARWRLVKELDDTLIYENLRALPRVWLATESKTMPGEEIKDLIQNNKAPNQFDFQKTVLLENSDCIKSSTPITPAAKAEITFLDDNQMTVNVKTDTDGFLVTADSYYPGWEVTVDGKSANLLKANYAIRAVKIPAGESTVNFIFAPTRLKWGLAISGVCLFAAALSAFALSKKTTKISNTAEN